MLADRLLSKGDYDCDRELRTLELLKVRFGEANLHNAEVMLKVRGEGSQGRRGALGLATLSPIHCAPRAAGSRW